MKHVCWYRRFDGWMPMWRWVHVGYRDGKPLLRWMCL